MRFWPVKCFWGAAHDLVICGEWAQESSNSIKEFGHFPRIEIGADLYFYMYVLETMVCSQYHFKTSKIITCFKLKLAHCLPDITKLSISDESVNSLVCKGEPPVVHPWPSISCSGGQNITIMGRNFDVIDNLTISHELKGNVNVDINVSLRGFFVIFLHWTLHVCGEGICFTSKTWAL